MKARQYTYSFAALMLGLSLGQAAYAQNAMDFFTNYLSNNVNNKQAKFDSAQLQTMANLDARRAQISTSISSSYGLSPQLANEYRAQLEQNRFLQNQYTTDGQFSFQEAQSVLNALNELDSRVQTTIGSSGVVPGASGNNWSSQNNWSAQQFNALQLQVANKLNAGLSSGQLRRNQYNMLKSQLDQLNARKAQISYSGRRSNRGETRQLMSNLTALDTQVTTELNDRRYAGRRNNSWR